MQLCPFLESAIKHWDLMKAKGIYIVTNTILAAAGCLRN